MRVFVTGATGFVGTAVVKELVSSGHQVVGLTRSTAGAKQLEAQGAESIHGTLDDLDVLRNEAAKSDAVIHLAFIHDFSNFAGACESDRAAITALGDTLAQAGGDRALIITSGTGMVMGPERTGDEDETPDLSNPMGAARGPSETLCLDYAKKGVRVCVVRLAPSTHGDGSSGFGGILIGIAMQKGSSGYLEEKQTVWNAVHRDDAARLYRMVLEKGKAGSVYHAVAEESVSVKDLATEVGKQLGIPVVGVPVAKAQEHFGWFAFGVHKSGAVSSAKTRERMGWKPKAPTLKEDIPVIVEYLKTQGKQ